MPEETGKVIKRAECSRCGGQRNCHIVGYFKDMHSEGDDRYTYDWCDEWHILQCAGCDFVFAQTVSTNSEDYDQDYDHDGSTVMTYNETLSYWPALSKRKRPEWLTVFINGYAEDGRERLSKALKELYGALDNDLHMLAGIGIRTCFDIASELLGVEGTATFAKKLDAIVDAAHIGKPDRSHLETLVEAGHASAHRGWTPTPEQLDTLMDILEYFIAEAFVRPEQQRERDAKVEKVKAHVPVRHVKKIRAEKSGK